MMGFQDDPSAVTWRLHLRSAPEAVYAALATDAGRASFWAESAVEEAGVVRFVFPNGWRHDAAVLEALAPRRFAVRYLGDSIAAFELDPDGRGGTDLTLRHTGVSAAERTEVIAGWVSVLLALAAAVDFGADLRSHDPQRHWDTGFVGN